MSTPRLLLSGPHPGVGGGVVAHCAALTTALRRRHLSVQQVHIGTGHNEDESAGARWHGLLQLLRDLPAFARSARGRVVHLNPSFNTKAALRDLVLLSVARLQGRRTVVQFHGGLPADLSGAAGRLALRGLCRADAVVVINRLQERALETTFADLKPRLHRIPNGTELPALDLDALIPARLASRELLFISRLLEEKGLLDAIRAVAQRPGLRLHVAGDGPAQAPAQALAAQLGVADRVVFHGRVGGQAKDALWRRAGAFVFPSYYPEGQPIVLLEALAYGLPVITCTQPAITDLIGPENGHLVAPRSPGAVAAAIEATFADAERYAQVSRHNRSLAAAHDLDLIGGRFEALYRALDRALAQGAR